MRCSTATTNIRSMMGMPELRTAIAAHYKHWQGVDLDATTEVMVTSGATEALAGAILGIVEPGDEVVLFEPMYDAYLPLVRLAGGVPKFVTLQPPHFRLTEEALAQGLLAEDQGGRVQQPAQPDGDDVLGRGPGASRRFLPPLRRHRDLRRGLGARGLRRPAPPDDAGARGHARALGEDRLGGQDLQPHRLEGRLRLRRARHHEGAGEVAPVPHLHHAAEPAGRGGLRAWQGRRLFRGHAPRLRPQPRPLHGRARTRWAST